MSAAIDRSEPPLHPNSWHRRSPTRSPVGFAFKSSQVRLLTTMLACMFCLPVASALRETLLVG